MTVGQPLSVFKPLAGVFERLLPNRCALCQSPSRLYQGKTQAICQACYSTLPLLGSSCRICSDEIPSEDELICGQCQQHRPHYDQAISTYRYAEPIDQLITGLKFSSRLTHARLLAELFHEANLDIDLPDMLIPMPLHPARLRHRGFNQSQELAQALAQLFNVDVNHQHCLRIRHTEPQSSLAFRERRRNIRNAFQVKPDINTPHVAIVDDVMTTGHSINELAKVLKQAGVTRVDAWLMARAVSRP